MNSRRLASSATLLAALAGLFWLALFLMTEPSPYERILGMPPADKPISMAVLGDSDSHSYQDRIFFPEGTADRGGVMRKYTLQWTEVLNRTRAATIDQGEWGDWGTRGLIARAQRLVGLPPGRSRKQDFRFNFAISGAVCGGLMLDQRAQALSLVRLMDLEPQRWVNGVVVIRLGGNPLARAMTLERFARDPLDPAASATLEMCVEDIRLAVRHIHATHPRTRVVLVGIFDNSHWGIYHDRWQSPLQLKNIASALDRYDDALRVLERTDPRVAFFDDRSWFDQRWGGRDPLTGRPAYREVAFGKALLVQNKLGDGLENACIADGHSGTVWNGLWAQTLVDFLNVRFGFAIKPIGNEELYEVIDPEGRFGIR